MKKKSRISLARTFPALLLCLLCLLPTAHADMGPKPVLTITVVNAPEGTLYIDLLTNEEPYSDAPYISADGSTAFVGELPYDPIVLGNLRSLEENGWVLAYSTGLDIPVYGDIRPSGSQHGNPVYEFGYCLPREFKLAAATADEAKITELFVLKLLYTSVVYDWAANTLTYAIPAPLLWATRFASTLIPTLIIEGLVFLLFGFLSRRSWVVFLCVNVITQIALHLVCAALNVSGMDMAFFWMFYLFLLVPELVIWGVEAAAYAVLLPEHSRGRRVGYAFTANILSYAVSYLPLHLLYEPFTRL